MQNQNTEGTRSGVRATEIADTIEAIFDYFKATKTAYPKMQAAVQKESSGWRAQVAGLRGADQQTLDKFFGQPSHKDVIAALEGMGIARENTPESQFRNAYITQSDKMTVDPSAYWPGKVVPTLGDYRSIIAFDAYREKLDNTQGPATQLLARLDAFEGGSGSRHASGNELYHQSSAYIQNTPRHPSEKYEQPADVKPDYGNAFHHTYNAGLNWVPSADMTTVSAARTVGHGSAENKSATLAYEKAKFEAALNERGGMNATVEVKFGATYADDKVIVTLPMDEYLTSYIPISQGKITIDTDIPGWGPNRNAFQTSEYYSGYEPGKKAYRSHDGLMVSLSSFNEILKAAPDSALAASRAAIEFGKAVKAFNVSARKIPGPAGEEDFLRIQRKEQGHSDKISLVDGRYYTSTDASNKVSGGLWEIEATLNAVPRKPEQPQHPRNDSDNAWFEHKGDIVVPRNDRYQQIALHMTYTYGVKNEWWTDDAEVKAKAQDREIYIIRTSKLKPEDRTAALADLQSRLEQAALPPPQPKQKPKPFVP